MKQAQLIPPTPVLVAAGGMAALDCSYVV